MRKIVEKPTLAFEKLSEQEVNNFFADIVNIRIPMLSLRTSGNEWDNVMWVGGHSLPKYKWFTQDMNAFFLLEATLTPSEQVKYLTRLFSVHLEMNNLIFVPLESRILPMFEVLNESLTEAQNKEESSRAGAASIEKFLQKIFQEIAAENEPTLPPEEPKIEPIEEPELPKAPEPVAPILEENEPQAHKQGFSFGDPVEWSSQANGNVKTKRGNVVGVIAAHHSVKDFFYETASGVKKVRDPGASRKHESYVILTEDNQLFWPLVSKLQHLS